MTSELDAIRATMRANYLPSEDDALQRLAAEAGLSADRRARITGQAAELVRAVRASSDPRLMEVFLSAYGLSTKEGVALMCLAEALLRVPDATTMDDLIRDKIAPHDWSAHSGGSSSIFVNASTWALMLTGKVLDEGEGGIEGTLRAMVRRLGEPVIRTAVSAAMREMGEQFVLGRSIEEAVRRGRPMTAKGYLYSYDMLGEAARTEADALRYHRAYADAISSLNSGASGTNIRRNPGISVKLSAIHPRYEVAQKETMLPVMSERLLELALAARHARMGLNIDAEEADRLDLSLDVVERVLAEPELAGWNGFGVVVQAYGPRAAFVIDWLYALARRLDRQIMVRLVKGAYWDTEIKRAQTLGLSGYPVFTRKANTDVSYIANARKLLSMTDRIYPQFATHNAHTVAAILEMADNRDSFEFQRLHGMGEALHETVRKAEGTRCRIYAPVGAHSDLLAYLVRRLLENGANSSFVHQITDVDVPAEAIARDPFDMVATQGPAANPAIAEPAAIFGASRSNSRGWDITDPLVLAAIEQAREAFAGADRWQAAPMTRAAGAAAARPVVNPARPDDRVGTVREATPEQVAAAVAIAVSAQPGWANVAVAERAAMLRRAADLYEANAVEFFALATREAGKTLADGIAEVREAVDFLRYYAAEAEGAEAGTSARGAIVCISPWNFPLAIFTGQIAAALATGNTVLAKPAEQTPLIAARAVTLLHEAGIPQDVLQLLPGDGPSVGGPLTADPRIAGVCFTGSTEVARLIEGQLAETAAPDAMLIAETGGLNAMMVDSTALPEQAVRDILAAAFQSAGQRCSALRILYVQKDVEKKVVEMLKGAMEELTVGDPWSIATDVGPVIDEEARAAISDYAADMEGKGRLVAKVDAPATGRFVAPQRLPRFRHRRDAARNLRAGAARRHVRGRAARPRHRRHQPQGFRPHLRPAHPHRGARAADRRRRPCRQHLCQPQPDRRRRRVAAVRRRGAVGHRSESRRPALSQALPPLRRRRLATCPRAARSRRPSLPTICRTRRWAAGRRGRIASPSCASICAARAPRRSRQRPQPISDLSTCRDRPARRIRSIWCRAAGLCASAPMPIRCCRRRCRRLPRAMPCWRWRRGRRPRCSRSPARACRSRRSTVGPIRSNRARWTSTSWLSQAPPKRFAWCERCWPNEPVRSCRW